MLIDAENPRTGGATPFGQLALEVILEPPLDGRSADVFPPPQAAAVHPVIMLHKHAATEWLGGSFPRQNAREPLPKRAATIFTTVFA
jgi:hypothetical protein